MDILNFIKALKLRLQVKFSFLNFWYAYLQSPLHSFQGLFGISVQEVVVGYATHALGQYVLQDQFDKVVAAGVCEYAFAYATCLQ